MSTFQLSILLAAASLVVVFFMVRSLSLLFSPEKRGLEKTIVDLEHAVQVIQDLSVQYFITLGGIGAGNLSHILASLRHADALCAMLAKQGRVREAESVLYYVHTTSGTGEVPPILEDSLPEDIQYLDHWKHSTQEIYERTFSEITRCSAGFKSLGCKREGRRSQPTSVLLGKLRHFVG